MCSTKESGTAQVVEMSFVLPMAMAVVVSLMYLTFFMFMYVYSYCVAETTTDDLSRAVGKGNIYWQINKEYISKEDGMQITEKMHDDLSSVCVIPGIGFDYLYCVDCVMGIPEVNVKITEKFLGKPIFDVSSKRKVYKPVQFADDVDAVHDISDLSDLENTLKGVLERLFGGTK